MDRQQRTEILEILLDELQDFQFEDVESLIIGYTSSERYFEVFTDITESYKRQENLQGMIREFVARIEREQEMIG